VTGELVDYTVDFGIVVVLAGMVLCLARLLRGPHLADRALSADALITHLVGLVLLFTIRAETLLLFDGALVLSLLGFVTTVAAAQYIVRRRLRRPREPQHPTPAGLREIP
jgi:multicomponent K+:H+ antiporter subunit F